MHVGQISFDIPEENFDDYLDNLKRGVEINLVKKNKFSEKTIYLSENYTLEIRKSGGVSKKSEIFKISSIVEIIKAVNHDSIKRLDQRQYLIDKEILSLILKNRTSINFIVKDGCKDRLINTIQYLKKICEKNERNLNYDLLIERTFKSADKDKDGRLSLKEACHLLRELNLKIGKDTFSRLFREVQLDESMDYMSEEEFTLFYNRLNNRREVRKHFEKYAKSKSANEMLMSTSDLQKFFIASQGEDRSLNYCSNIIKIFSNSCNTRYLTIYDFTSFLRSDLNDLNEPFQKEKMDYPLDDYYIATSHNTYLMQHQLHGMSSVDGYIRCLLSGCRCVELDCYDGLGEPKITHGFTLTGNISFRSVVEAINQYAFVTSPFPVILSMENHCSIKGQNQMADILKQVFKDRLFVPDPQDIRFPSLNELKYKIIIKDKKNIDLNFDDVSSGGYVSDSDSPGDSICGRSKKKSVYEYSKKLSCLVGMKTKSFPGALQIERNQTTICSISENKAKKLITESPEEFAEFCRSVLVKVYPKGARTINSSNLNPIPFWAKGVSVVAINYQYLDEANHINSMMFSSQLGYVLKPPFLRESDARSCLYTTQSVSIRVISGIDIPNSEGNQKDIVDPFVVVSIMGSESNPPEMTTEWIQDNGFNPYWNETFLFTVKMVETAFVKFAVMDYGKNGNTCVGFKIFKLSKTRRGIRAVHLVDKSGEPIGMACLLVEIIK